MAEPITKTDGVVLVNYPLVNTESIIERHVAFGGNILVKNLYNKAKKNEVELTLVLGKTTINELHYNHKIISRATIIEALEKQYASRGETLNPLYVFPSIKSARIVSLNDGLLFSGTGDIEIWDNANTDTGQVKSMVSRFTNASVILDAPQSAFNLGLIEPPPELLIHSLAEGNEFLIKSSSAIGGGVVNARIILKVVIEVPAIDVLNAIEVPAIDI